jgi:hypothetical protein
MKKYIFAFVAAMTILATTSFASPVPEPGYRILEQFRKEFPNAQDVSWVQQAEFMKASFVLAGRRVIAYFSEEGSLEGTMRDIFFDQLPLTVMTGVEKRFNNPVILYVREIINAEGTHYRIRLDLGDRKLMVRVSADGSITDIDRIK